MKKHLMLALLLSLALTGCNKAVEENITEQTVSQNEVADSTEETVTTETPESTTESTDEVVEIPGMELVEIEIDGEVYESIEDIPEDIFEEEAEHVTLEGGEDIDASIGSEVQINGKGEVVSGDSSAVLNLYEQIPEDNEYNPALLPTPEEIKVFDDYITKEESNGYIDNNDITMLMAIRPMYPIMFMDPEDGTTAVRIFWPTAPTDNTSVKYLASTGKVAEISGKHEDIMFHPVFASAPLKELTMEYKNVFYRVTGPITAEEFETNYKPYCRNIKGYRNHFFLVNNIDGCKGSVTSFIELEDGSYLPISYGSKTQEIREDKLELTCDAMTMMVLDGIYSTDELCIYW